MRRHLQFMGLYFLEQCRDFRPWVLDFYLSEWHLCIEVDGPYMHHAPATNAKRDADLLERFGIPTLRFDVSRRQPTRKQVMLSVIAFVELHEPTTRERMEQWRHHRQNV